MSWAKDATVWEIFSPLTLSWRRPISYRNQSIDLWSKSMDWFLYDIGLRHDERVKEEKYLSERSLFKHICSWCGKFIVLYKWQKTGNTSSKNLMEVCVSNSVGRKNVPKMFMLSPFCDTIWLFGYEIFHLVRTQIFPKN